MISECMSMSCHIRQMAALKRQSILQQRIESKPIEASAGAGGLVGVVVGTVGGVGTVSGGALAVTPVL